MFAQHRKSSRVNPFLWLSLVLFLMTLAPLAASAQNRLLSSHVPPATSLSRVVEHLSNGTRLNLAISLPLRNEKELKALAAAVSDPSSPRYKHYWTPPRFAAEFGPTPKDYQALTDFARSNNLTIMGTHSNRLVLTVSGETADIERAFNIEMMVYQHPARGRFYAPDREPTVSLDLPVEHVSGLDNFAPPRPMDLKALPLTSAPFDFTGSGPIGLLQGSDFRAAYAPGVTQTGLGQSLALVEFDGFYTDDVSYNFDYAGLPRMPVQTVLLDGYDGTPRSSEDEVVLDIMMASYMAPGLQNVISYEGYIPDDILDRIATDDIANQVSSSWGFGIDATTEQIFLEFIVQGQSVVESSGDQGAYPGVVMTPSDNPNLTIVGGTDLSTNGAGGPWSSEYAWAGSGGGFSTAYPIPGYQQGMSMDAIGGSTTMRNLPDVAAVATDIFLICNHGQFMWIGGTSASAPLWAGFVALANQEAATNGRSPVGFLNPTIYALGNSNSYAMNLHDISTGSNGFPAIPGYDLATGWGSPVGQSLVDALSQAGVENFQIAISNPTLTLYQSNTTNTTVSVQNSNGFTGTVSFAASGLPAGVAASFASTSTANSALLTFSASSSATPGTYNIAVIGTAGNISSTGTVQLIVTQPTLTLTASVNNVTLLVGGPGVTATISVTNTVGFTGSVKLSASAVPKGVKVSFSAISIGTTGTSVVTFTPNNATPAGLFIVQINGTSGSATGSVSVQLNIPQPSLAVSPTTANLNLSAGSSIGDSIGVSTSNVANNVILSASGLPSGLTASFAPASVIAAGGSSNVTFTAANSLAAGTYSISVTGTSGTTTMSAPLQITVAVPPSFSLFASPASIVILEGGASGNTTVNVVGQNGFNGNVTLSASGVPSGVTAAFSSANTMTASGLTFAASANAAPGSYLIGISGASGNLSASAKVLLTIPTPTFSLSISPSALTLLVGGAPASATVNIAALNGASSVVLSAPTLPVGLTASFSPFSANGSSQITLLPTASLAPGVYTIAIKGTSASYSASTSIRITVPTPSFTLSAQARNLAVRIGESSSDLITITRVNGFNGNVSLSMIGLPAGVTSSFTAGANSTNSSLSIAVGVGTASGIYPLTIKGTSGSLSSATNVQLTVPAPSFTLSSSKSAMTVLVAGISCATALTVGSPVDLTSAITLAVTGLPLGVTGEFSPSSTTSTSTLTLTPTIKASPGNYTVHVRGTSGSATSAVNILLTVPAPSFTLASSNSALSVLLGGAAVSTTITVVKPLNLANAVVLSVAGVPRGVAAAFSSSSTTSASTLTFTPSATSVPGAYKITVKGVSAARTASTTILLTIPTAGFALTAASGPKLKVGGSAGSSRISVASQNGFAGIVSLSVSGLPAGVTASFTPAVTSSTSKLILTPSLTVAVGSYSAAVKGISGSVSSSIAVPFTVSK